MKILNGIKFRSETAKFSNNAIRCALYASTFIYCVVPYGIFFIKYYFLKMNVQKVTSSLDNLSYSNNLLYSFSFDWKNTVFFHLLQPINLLASFLTCMIRSIYKMFYAKMVNYCATYYIFVQTKIHMLNNYLQVEDLCVEQINLRHIWRKLLWNMTLLLSCIYVIELFTNWNIKL